MLYRFMKTKGDDILMTILRLYKKIIIHARQMSTWDTPECDINKALMGYVLCDGRVLGGLFGLYRLFLTS